LLARFRSPRTFLFYHNFKRLSRTFFKIFQSFSKPLTKLSVAIRSAFAAAFRLYHTRIRLSRTFFVSFQTFSTVTRSPGQPLSAAYSVYHNSRSLSSPFFEFFQTLKGLSKFASDPVFCSSPLLQQPEYLSTSRSVCQDPFFDSFDRSLIPTPRGVPRSSIQPPSRTACIY